MKLLVFSLFAVIAHNITMAQCATSGTISSNCTTTGNLTASGNLTINSGVTVTVTGTFDANGKTITATGANINAANFSEPWAASTLTGGNYTISGNFSSSGALTSSGITVNVTGTLSLNGGGASLSYTNSSFTCGSTVYFGDQTHTINNTSFNIATDNSNSSTEVMSLNGNATLNFSNGATMYVNGSMNAGNSATLNINNSTLTVAGNFDNAGNGHVNVTNNGVFVVDGNYDNSGSGSTTVGSGSLVQVGGTYNNSGGGSTAVNGGALSTTSYSGSAPTGDTGGNCTTGGCCGSACSTLPVTLIHFKASKEGSGVKLSWSTATEVNNNYFTIYRSFDGVTFTEVSKVSGQGSTKIRTDYELTDAVNRSGLIYYQLKQTDYDGTEEFFPLIMVKSDAASTYLKVRPTSLKSGEDLFIDLSIGSEVPVTELSIIDLTGRSVYHLSGIPDTNSIKLTISELGLPPGTYIVRGRIGSELIASKFFLN